MKEKKLFIPIILGTNREGRQSEKVARWIFSEIQKREDIETQLIDIQDFDLPANHYGIDLAEKFPGYREAISSADGLIMVFPEYNHGIPGHLKGVLDVLLKEYKNKAVGFASVSAGSWGGIRAVDNILVIARHIGLVAISKDLPFPKVKELFDEEGNILDDKFPERLEKFLDELVWMAQALKWGRENLE